MLDKSGNSIIVEPLIEGIKIYDNFLGVMSNSPDYNWHLTNIRNYIGLNNHYKEPLKINGLEFKPFGQGGDSFGIPGDYTPPSSFFRALFNKLSILNSKNEEELVVNTNNVLNSVKVPRGSVITQRNTLDCTQHTSFMISNNSNYYFTLYSNPELCRVKLFDYNLELSIPFII